MTTTTPTTQRSEDEELLLPLLPTVMDDDGDKTSKAKKQQQYAMEHTTPSQHRGRHQRITVKTATAPVTIMTATHRARQRAVRIMKKEHARTRRRLQLLVTRKRYIDLDTVVVLTPTTAAAADSEGGQCVNRH